MDYTYLIVEIENRLAIITINRPDKLNALNLEILKELKTAFSSFENNIDVSVIIITGAAEKAFAAGADISEISRLDKKSGEEFSASGQEVFNRIENFSKPVIAAVNGYALGGGCELALACHFRIASENARFGQPEINLGLVPGYGGTQRFSRLTGKGLAIEYMLTGDPISSEEALRIGLVNRIFPQTSLMTEVKKIASKIASKSGFTSSRIIRAANASDQLQLAEGMKLEAELFGECCGSEDFREGTSAFLEKRKPEFRNK